MTYPFLLESVWHPPLAFAEQAPAPLPSELELQALWFAGAFGRDFRCVDGRAARIVQFGEWNRGAGPDFAQVAVEIDGVLNTGGLEIDSTATDWEAHGHAENPAFREVVLHVIFAADGRRVFTRTVDHREIPQVVVPAAKVADAMNRPLREVAIARPGRCVSPLKHLSTDGIDRLLADASHHRARLKAGRFLRIADAHSRESALFQVTAETLGYRGNALAMKLLAQRAPLSALRADLSAAEAILFGTAGFLCPDLHELARPEVRDYLRVLWETWWRERSRFEMGPDRQIEWKTHGQRPANHPHRRTGTLAALVADWPGFSAVALARPFKPAAVIEYLDSLRHPFWERRYTLGSLESPQKVALFGRSQALELLANHLIPLALVEEGIKFRDYHKLRSSLVNEKVRRCGIRLFGSEERAKPWLKRVCHHQALLQVYHDFCLEDFSDCARCPFPEQLSQWK